jgi:L-lactate dehydrogenase complex protein LldE
MAPRIVQLFTTCLVNELFPEVGFSVVKVLESLGCQVELPLAQVCCGQPAYNAGYMADSRKVALSFLEAFEKTQGPIVIPSGSCCDMISHHLPGLFEEGSAERARALGVASRAREFSQFLVDDLGAEDLGGRCEASIAYHPSCHLSRGLSVKEQPLRLIKAVKGARLLSFQNAEECCGFGGSFSVTHDELSGAMLQDKMDQISKPQPERVVSCDMGCLMHLEGGFRHKGASAPDRPRIQHLAQFLAESLP